MIRVNRDDDEDYAGKPGRWQRTPMMKDIWTTMNITVAYVKVLHSPRRPFCALSSFIPPVLLPRYEQINRRGRRRGRILWSPIGGQLTLIHYYRGYGRRFWVVISSNPSNGVVYLVAIFTRLEARRGGPSVHYFYAIVVFPWPSRRQWIQVLPLFVSLADESNLRETLCRMYAAIDKSLLVWIDCCLERMSLCCFWFARLWVWRRIACTLADVDFGWSGVFLVGYRGWNSNTASLSLAEFWFTRFRMANFIWTVPWICFPKTIGGSF